MMRIAYLINQYPKTSHTFIRREILAVEALGYKVARVALRGWTESAVDVQDQLEQLKTVYVLKDGLLPLLTAVLQALISSPAKFLRSIGDVFTLSKGGDRPFWVYFIYLFEACWIQREFKRWAKEGDKIDHVHVHFGTNPAAVALLLNSVGGPPYSFTVHGCEEFDRPESLKLGFKASRAHAVVGISSFCQSQLYRWISLNDWDKVSIVRCGLEPAYFESSPTSPTPTDSQNVQAPPVFLSIGRLCGEKGYLVLIEAASILNAKGVQFNLVFAGDGELRADIERRVDENGLRSKVRITGWISSEQVRSEIASAKVLVVSSFAEGLPVVIMEAMAMCKPVIATYVAGIPELVKHEETGWLVPAGDSNELADAMLRALNAPQSQLSDMGLQGHKRALEDHSISRSASKLVQVFEAK
jgi:colanic acid/amylovoran biosynthesis glycosyltransferase